jgi:GntR family transcriptional regulator
MGILGPRRCGNMHHMVDHGSATALYVQVADIIAQKIEAGEYAPGQRLPSADDLAEMYEIAPNTALKALRELRKRGLAEMSHGRGTYVKRQAG